MDLITNLGAAVILPECTRQFQWNWARIESFSNQSKAENEWWRDTNCNTAVFQGCELWPQQRISGSPFFHFLQRSSMLIVIIKKRRMGVAAGGGSVLSDSLAWHLLRMLDYWGSKVEEMKLTQKLPPSCRKEHLFICPWHCFTGCGFAEIQTPTH